MGDNPTRRGLCNKPKGFKKASTTDRKTGVRKTEPVFKMPPLPSIDCFKNDPWMEHPLLHYQALNEKRRQDNEVVIRRGKKVKNAVADVVFKKTGGKPIAEDDTAGDLEAFLTQDDFAEYRRDSVKAAPVVPLQKDKLKRITAMLSKPLKRNHPNLFRSLVKEVQERYEIVLHETILNFVLVPPPGYVNPYALEITYPMFSSGPPPWRDSYRINRHLIAQQLRSLYPIVSKAFLKMRELMKMNKLFYPEKIRESGSDYMRPGELKDIIIQQIRSNGDMFLQKFVPQLVRIFQNPTALKSTNDIKLELIMECASHMINLNATTWAIETIREIVVTYENYSTYLPRILVDTAVDDSRIVYAPPMEGWMYCFKKMMDEIVGIVQNIPDASELFWTKTDADKSISVFSKITLPTYFVEEMTERFYAVMSDWLSHAQEVSDRIYEQYKPLLDGSCRARLQAFVASKDHVFYEAFKESAILKKYSETMYDIPKNEFGGWLQVNNEDVTGRLLDSCKSHQNILSDHLTNWMRDHNNSIIDGYTTMRDRLLRKPATTAELMELIEYIDEARGVVLLLLKEDIIEGLKMCLSFMDYYLMSAEDIELTVTAHKLLRKIQPAFEKSAIMIEDYKVIFEEQLHQKIAEMRVDLGKLLRRIRDDFGRYGDYSKVTQYCEDSRYVLKRVSVLKAGVEWINNEEVLFKFNQTKFPDMDEIMYNLEPYSRLFQVADRWQRAEKKYMDGDFDLDAEQIDAETEGYEKELVELQKLFKSRIKEDKEREAKEKHIPVSMLYDEDNLDEIPPPLKLCNITLESLTKFRSNYPTMQILCNPHLRKRHWITMSGLSELEMVPDTGSSLRKLLAMNLAPHMEDFADVSFTATQEYILAETIGKMKESWSIQKIESVPYKETETNILLDADETRYLLKRHIYQTQILKGSRFAIPHKDVVLDWESSLLRAKATMDEWLKSQSTWTYLEHMFSSEDIQAIMPTEGQLFIQADEIWRTVMADVDGQENALETAKKEGLLEKLTHCNKLLEKVKKGLDNYLEEKRIFFPRLFFLTNEEMVEILSETKDPNQIQPYLVKLFEGISELRIDSELLAFGVLSVEGERITFSNPVDTAGVKGCVEKWLSQIETTMVETMKNITIYAKDAFMHTSRAEWITKWPGQVVLYVSQVYWTSEVHKAFLRSTTGIQNYLAKWNTHLDNTVALVRGQLTKLQRSILGNLVTVDVHARDILEEMIANKVQEDTEFLWVVQLRHYFEDFQVVIRCINSHINYGYEYLGNPSRLILTPLTDRCFRILIGAYHLNLNGAVIGTTASGKTETVKQLARTIGKQFYIFDCSEELDYSTIGRFIKGLASAGAWVCFDDFNRMDPSVMSVLAPQLWTIHQSVAAKMETCVLEGTELPLNLACFSVITMNPFIGQHELPENLKTLFRPVALMVPDFEVISDVYLFAKGFLHSKSLSRKLHTVCKLCFEQLSTQGHYDYGMRAVKSILTAAGNLKLKYPEEIESRLILTAITDVNLPKFVAQDIPLFEGIISDLFPGVKLLRPDMDPLIEALKVICEQSNLQPTDFFIEKTLQIYEMILVRHGLMIVGEAFCGKTCSYQSLAAALTDIKNNKPAGFVEKRVQYKIFNPKAITMGQLYGCFDPVSHEWSDGLLANAFREMSSSTNDDRKWIVFDGPVDAVWIENMNTVLDDNKKLCLMSGEIIQMTPVMNMMFEPSDLEHASPATVSRCGMIYFEPKQLGWRPLKDSYLGRLPSGIDEEQKEILEELFEWIIPACLEFIRLECKSFIPTSELHQFQSFVRLFGAILKGDTMTDDLIPQGSIWVQCCFVFCVVWSLGATLIQESREKFDTFYRPLLLGNNKQFPKCKSFKLTKNQLFPERGSVFDYICDRRTNQWRFWLDMIDRDLTKTPAVVKVNDLIIPTDETARQQFFLKTYLNNQNPLLFVGPTGTGKSAITFNYMMSLPKEKYVANIINFSAQTTANQTQDIIMSKLDKRSKGIFGPPIGKKCAVFIDDLSMPQKEIYGAQPPIELLRQWIDHGNWYDLKNSSTLTLVDVLFVGAMGPPGGGRNDITARLVRHMSILGIDSFDDNIMKKIFTAIVDWHFGKDYDNEILRWARLMIPATMQIYKSTISLFLPTPAKSHYVFNLRDFSRVVRGLLLIPPTNLRDPTKLQRLWVHEVYRVFYDRLVDDDDRQEFFTLMTTCVQDNFKTDAQKLLGHLAAEGQPLQDVNIRSLIFGDYMDPQADEKIYDEVVDLKELSEIMEGYLTKYNSTSKAQMPLVLFQFAIEHISRIARVLKQDNGHALLIGIGGSGRQSLTKLAAFMSGYELIQIEISRTYGTHEWREDLKKVLKHAGKDGKKTVFLFADNQIKDESFVEDINMILNTGDVPDIFAAEEMGEILDEMQSAAKEYGKRMETSPLVLYHHFIERVRSNLHVVLAMSPVGDAFRVRLRMFPSLITCCTIDWFSEWPEDALAKVAQKFLSDFGKDDSIPEACVLMCQYFHESVRKLSIEFYNQLKRKNYVTPTLYLELILTFKSLLSKKREEIEEQRKRYLTGLDKFKFAALQVSMMQDELTALRPQLIETSEATERLMKQIELDKLDVEATKLLVAAEEALCNDAAAAAQAIRDECEHDLAEAIPILEAALLALDTLKPSDIAIVRSMKNPPAAVKMVVEAVCVLRSVKPEKKMDANGRPYEDYWGSSLRMLGDMKFLDALKEYDKDHIPPAAMKKIREKFINAPEFDPAKMKYVSTACEGLCRWVKAMEVYDRVIKVVGPKQLRLAEAERELQRQLDKLNAQRALLQQIEDKLQALNDQYAAMLKTKRDLELHIEMCTQKLMKAEKIIERLGGEKTRWSEGAAMLADKYYSIVGDILIAAAVIVYLGPFTMDFRDGCVVKWQKLCSEHKIPCLPVFSLITTLGDPVRIRNWHLAGLPIDTFSIDNAIIATNARRWPLMIDPQAQATKWVRNFEKVNGLVVIKLSESGYVQTVENAIQEGLPVLLDNVGEEIDHALEPVLLKQTFMQDEIVCIKIGENVVEYNKDFRFYIITRLRNPHYLPEIAVKVTLINFMITPLGLQNQLLGIVAAKEEPELEEQKNQLVIESINNKNLLKELEDKILEVLSSSTVNILEDDTSLQIVYSSMELSQEIFARQEIAAVTEKKIDEIRNTYRPVAVHGTILFFCISDLANIDPMYQYSLEWFISLYSNSITHSRQSKELAQRIQYLNEHFTSSMYRNVCQSLFEKDKLVFSFVLCIALMKSKGDFDMESWKFLLTGGTNVDNPHPNPAPKWLSEKSWSEIVRLSDLPKFETLRSHVVKHTKHWKELYYSSEPQDMKLPSPFYKMDDLKRLAILRCFRLDKLVPAVQNFITSNLGKEFIEPPTFDLESSFEDSSSAIPLVFILSPGADPTLDLFKFAADKGYSGSKIQSLSLGQGQGPVARQMIEESSVDGNWVVLQNCHLATSWMPVLEMICQDVITAETTDPGFRLWLTSYPSPHFPVTVLQNSVKMTIEPPLGLRANLLRSYTGNPISDYNFFGSVRVNARAWHRMLFGLCFFHAVVQERRRYRPLGWNNLYEFSESDLRISLMQLQTFLSENLIVPYDALTYLTGECNYGGRVTDDKDRRLLNSLLSIFYTSKIVETDDYVLSPSGIYHVPGDAEYNSCLAYIRQLSLNVNPEAFGLHENASITKGIYETKQLLEGALLTQTELKSGDDGADTSASKVTEIAQDILNKLPADFDLEVIMEKFPVDYMNSMNTVLRQELIRFNRLTIVVRETLINVQNAIKGMVVLTPELDEMFKSILVGRVPKAWASKSYPSLKPLGSYVTDLLQRLSFLKTWIDNGAPSVFWLSGFFFTQSFLTGVTQNYARKHKIPIDHLGFESEITEFEKNANARPEDGAYCRGLFLAGARWDRHKKKLAESYPKILHDPIPVVWFKPGIKAQFVDKPSYDCPLYNTSARSGTLSTTGHSTNFVLYLKLLTDLPQQHWINRGTAALCQLDE